MPHWAFAYIGLPWSATGDGPGSFHCWALVRHVQKERFGRDLPAIPNPEDLFAIAKHFRDHPERRRWAMAETPQEGDCVLMRQARYPVHVGIWLSVDGGKVLHAIQGLGVVAQSPASLAAHGWRVEGYYRFMGDRA
ncbi:MAG: C40 family peptidase [Alphaproteobacteria bacterium]|nr:C40 family peptidase [Alphaproteobacteria bacterium]